MKLNSLAFRLFSTAAAWTLIALPIVGLIIYTLIQNLIMDGFDTRLQTHAWVLQAEAIGAGSEPERPANVGEPLFGVTNSGWYWQIRPLAAGTGRTLVSDSLATGSLPSAYERGIEPNGAGVRLINVEGPVGQPLRIAELVDRLGGDGPMYSFSVAGPLEWPRATIYRFGGVLALALALTGLALLAATLLQVKFGLQPLSAIEKGLAAIRSGEAERLDGDFPAEIQPLQSELNALMESNQDIIDRARTQVGNLAHALKTPLAVISNEASDTKTPFASKVAEQATIMRDQVSLYLDRARMAASANTIGRVTPVLPVTEALQRALERIYLEKGLAIEIDCDAALSFRGEKHDLEEMLGNLLDNASKWSKRNVRMSASMLPHDPSRNGRWLQAVIEDDGDGVCETEREKLTKRGVRLDETKPGSGLGLSIVSDLVASYRGTLELGEASVGGLKVVVTLPAADTR